MDLNKEIYLVLLESTDPSLSLGESIRESFFVTRNFKKAYYMAIDLSGIKDPAPGYRRALDEVRSHNAATIRDRSGSKQTIISVIKKY